MTLAILCLTVAIIAGIVADFSGRRVDWFPPLPPALRLILNVVAIFLMYEAYRLGTRGGHPTTLDGVVLLGAASVLIGLAFVGFAKQALAPRGDRADI